MKRSFASISPAWGFQKLPACCPHIYIPRSETSARGGESLAALVLQTLVGRTAVASPRLSPDTVIIPQNSWLVNPLFQNFWKFFWFSLPPWRPLPKTPCTRPRRLHSNLAVPSCFPPSLDVLIIHPNPGFVKPFFHIFRKKFCSQFVHSFSLDFSQGLCYNFSGCPRSVSAIKNGKIPSCAESSQITQKIL